VHAVEGLAAAAREEVRDSLVRGDHQLLDEPMRSRLRLLPGPCDTAAPVELEVELGALDPQRAAPEPPRAQLRGQTVDDVERPSNLGPCAATLGLHVGQPRLAADD
jgi:hypothetical protein